MVVKPSDSVAENMFTLFSDVEKHNRQVFASITLISVAELYVLINSHSIFEKNGVRNLNKSERTPKNYRIYIVRIETFTCDNGDGWRYSMTASDFFFCHDDDSDICVIEKQSILFKFEKSEGSVI